ncbi:AfsR/SARP family transcriptional regulator [Micromonospora haikouensis]|uniref:AfsR/SARP family transcriptional regulator n=1 Tax=Micromonospora haikouensis TaxID=686309 RepID=UPI003D748D63
MRWPRQVASAAALATVVAGPPVVLARTVGWPLPTRPTQEQLHQWISDPLTEETLIAGLVLLAWTLWALLASIALRATAARVVKTVRRLRRVPLPTPMQATATGMAGAAALWTPATTSTATIDAPTPTPTATDHQPSTNAQRTAAPGVDIPGGWLPADTAHQIAAASALVWLRRRRAYQPQPPGHPRDDSDLTALPPTVTAVQAATPPATRPTPAPTLALATGGIGLTGPGAADAARGVLLTTLLQTLRPTGHPTTAVVTTRADLHRLLGAHTPALQHLPGLTVTDTVDDAITTLTQTNNPSATSPTLLTHIPTDPTTGARLAIALTHTVGVLVGTWTHGATWHIEADGHTQPDISSDRTRLCVLTDTAARDLLTVLALTPATPPATAVPRQRPPTPTPPPASSPPKPLTLHVLGNPTLRADGTPVPIRRSAALQILVALAAHPDGRTTRELATTIWPGLAPHTVTRRLYTTLSDLRKDITTTGLPNPIEHTNDRYHLNQQHIDVDLWQLNAAIDHAATALTNHTHAYQTIIDHYTGDIAAHHTWPWLDPIREKTRRHVIDAHTALADHTPDLTTRLHQLQGALRVDPFNEHLHRQAADTLTALGKPQDAEALLARYHQRLAQVAPEESLPTRSQFGNAAPSLRAGGGSQHRLPPGTG